MASTVPVETGRAMAEERVAFAKCPLQLPSAVGVGPADQGTLSGGVQQMEQQLAAEEVQLQVIDDEITLCVSKPHGLIDTERSAELQSETEVEAAAILVEKEATTMVEESEVHEATAMVEGTEVYEATAMVERTEVHEATAMVEGTEVHEATAMVEGTEVHEATVMVEGTEVHEATAIVMEERTVSSNADRESTESGASRSPERQSTLCDSEQTIQAPSWDKHALSTPVTAKDQVQDDISEVQSEVTETSLSPNTCTLGVVRETPEEVSVGKQEGRESQMEVQVPDISSSAIEDHSMQDTLKVEGKEPEEAVVGTDAAVAVSGELPNRVKEESCSRDPTPEVGGVLTKTMVDEERRLRDRASPESTSSVDNEVQELTQMKEAQRFTRLQHLLEKSSIYSTFLLKRMEKEKEQKEQRVGRKKKIVGQTTPASAGDHQEQAGEDSGTLESTSASQESDSKPNSQESSSKPESQEAGSKSESQESGSTTASKAKKPARTRGRKRKAECESYKLSDYMDNQGRLKKRKVEGGEAAPAPPTATPTTASKSVEEEVKQERYYNGQPIPARQPKLMTGGIMRSYQLDGMEWVKVLYENGVNGILADEMGLGKTIQCIGVVAHMIEMGVKGPFLVAAPLSTVPNWVEEFRRFTPSIPVVLYHGTVQEREQLRRKHFSGDGRAGSASSKKGKGKAPLDEPLQPVMVTSYEICMKDQRFLMCKNWKFLVVDEGHRIKNLNCKLIRALKSYDAANRLLLTGTPLQNNLAELWSLLNFLLPDIFDDLNSFQSWFDFGGSGEDEVRERIIAQEREQNVLSTLHQILTPFLLRRLKTDVEFGLPPKKEVLVYAPLTTTQQRYYKSLLDKTIMEMIEAERMKKLEALGKENTPSGERPQGGEEGGRLSTRKRRNRSRYSQLSDTDFESLLQGEVGLEEITKPEQKKEEKKVFTSATNIKMTNVFMMLRKCCNHPYLLEFPMTPEGQFRVDEELIHSCGKIMLLDRLLPALIKDGHKMLVFSQFTMMLDILEDFLELRGLSYSRLDGTMAFSERQRQMTVFREDPDCHVFLLSTRAGGLGINLTAADTVIIYDSDWNPQADLQAQDRCHRIGQTKPVMVYRLVTANTIDQRIVERAARKRRLEKMVIHKGKFKGGSAEEQQLSLDDLIDLLHSVDHERVVGGNGAVISDDALMALLDRSFTSKEAETAATTRAGANANRHDEVFKVLEERDVHGNVLHSMAAKSKCSVTHLDQSSYTG